VTCWKIRLLISIAQTWRNPQQSPTLYL
jgi:hypothetical protein